MPTIPGPLTPPTAPLRWGADSPRHAAQADWVWRMRDVASKCALEHPDLARYWLTWAFVVALRHDLTPAQCGPPLAGRLGRGLWDGILRT